MFGEPGIAYVYFTYGMHHCLNAVAGPEGDASAVLIRAIEPLWGTSHMRGGAPTKLPGHLVASGPGRLCRALRIDKRLNGADLTKGPIRVLAGEPAGVVNESPRVGLTTDDERPWRFFTASASVSTVSSRRPGRRR
jgi:DNA-3-methyladenine glycosylase